MKRWSMLMMALFSLLNSLAMAQEGSKVLMIAREGDSGDLELMLAKEAGVMRDMLSRAGFEVVVASVSGRTMKADTTSLEPDMRISDVNLEEYRGVILPCLAIDAEKPSPEVIALAKEAAADGLAVAAQTSSVMILAKAGILAGKQYAYSRHDVTIQKAIYKGIGVVQDGKIITSGVCPYMAKRREGVQDGTSKLTEAFINELKK